MGGQGGSRDEDAKEEVRVCILVWCLRILVRGEEDTRLRRMCAILIFTYLVPGKQYRLYIPGCAIVTIYINSTMI